MNNSQTLKQLANIQNIKNEFNKLKIDKYENLYFDEAIQNYEQDNFNECVVKTWQALVIHVFNFILKNDDSKETDDLVLELSTGNTKVIDDFKSKILDRLLRENFINKNKLSDFKKLKSFRNFICHPDLRTKQPFKTEAKEVLNFLSITLHNILMKMPQSNMSNLDNIIQKIQSEHFPQKPEDIKLILEDIGLKNPTTELVNAVLSKLIEICITMTKEPNNSGFNKPKSNYYFTKVAKCYNEVFSVERLELNKLFHYITIMEEIIKSYKIKNIENIINPPINNSLLNVLLPEFEMYNLLIISLCIEEFWNNITKGNKGIFRKFIIKEFQSKKLNLNDEINIIRLIPMLNKDKEFNDIILAMVKSLKSFELNQLKEKYKDVYAIIEPMIQTNIVY